MTQYGPESGIDPLEIEKLDLERYGLGHLNGVNLLDISEEDMDKLLKALGDEDISLNIPIPCTPFNVNEVLTYGNCRRCGRCCIPNPLNPGNPGVEAFESELRAIAQHTRITFEELQGKTLRGKVVAHPFEPTKLSFTRWLPLPCPYHNENTGCRIYPVRPIVCVIHPVVFTEDNTRITIKANCEYGKELIKAALQEVKKKDPSTVIPL